MKKLSDDRVEEDRITFKSLEDSLNRIYESIENALNNNSDAVYSFNVDEEILRLISLYESFSQVFDYYGGEPRSLEELLSKNKIYIHYKDINNSKKDQEKWIVRCLEVEDKYAKLLGKVENLLS